MKNKILLVITLLVLANLKSFSQANTVTAKTINALNNIYLSSKRLDSISTDGLFTLGSNFVIPTQLAIKTFVNGKITTFTAAGDVQGTSSGAYSLTPTLVIQPLTVTGAKIANSTIALGKFINGPPNNYIGFDNSGVPIYIPPDTLILRTLGTGVVPVIPISRNVLGIRAHRDSLAFHIVINGDSSETWWVAASSVSTGGVGVDSVITITSGTSSTVTNGYNIVRFNPASALSTYTLTLPTTWHTSNDLLISFSPSAFTSGNVVTTLIIVGGAGQTLVQSVVPTTGTYGEIIRYHLISGTVDQRTN